MKKFPRNTALWVFVFTMFLMLWSVMNPLQQKPSEIPYSKFKDALTKGQIEKVSIKKREILGEFKDAYGDGLSNKFLTYLPTEDPKLVEQLSSSKVEFSVIPKQEGPWYVLFLWQWAPILLFGVGIICITWIIRR